MQASSSCTNTSPADPAKSGPWPCRVSLPEGRLALPAAAVEAVVFRPVVDKIIAAAKEMVEESRAAGGKPVDKVSCLRRVRVCYQLGRCIVHAWTLGEQ